MITLLEYGEQFVEAIDATRATKRTYASALRRFALFLAHGRAVETSLIDAVTLESLAAYRVWLTKEAVHRGQGRPDQNRRALMGYGTRTIRSSLAALGCFVRWLDINHFLPSALSAADMQAILKTSMRHQQGCVRPKRIREAVPLVVTYYAQLPLPSVFEKNDRVVRQALSLLRNRALTSVLLSTGLRAKELTGMKRGDWDKDKALVCVVGKSEKARFATLDPKAQASVARYLSAREEYFSLSPSPGQEPLFARHDPTAQPGTSLMPITTKTVWQVVARAVDGLKRQGYPIDDSISPQDFRRYLAANYRPTPPGGVEQAARSATRK